MKYYRYPLIVVCLAASLAGCANADKPALMRSSPPPASAVKLIHTNKQSAPTDTYQRPVWLTYIELADMFSRESCEEDFRTYCG